MTPRQQNKSVRLLLKRFYEPPPQVEPDEWAESGEIVLAGKNIKGVPNFIGRDYMRKPLRDLCNPKVRRTTLVWARGNAKTLLLEISLYFQIVFGLIERMLGIYPTRDGEGGSSNFLTTRAIPTIRKSPAFAALLPDGQERFYMNKSTIRLGGTHCGFIGGASAAQGVGNRLNRIDADEIEKLSAKLGNEADIIKIAEGSTEGVEDWHINLTSTPTIDSGPIWQSLMRSNLHLRFLPCPHCSSLAKTIYENESKNEKRSEETRNGFLQSKNKNGSVAYTRGKRSDSIQSKSAANNNSEEKKLTEAQRVALCLAESFKGWFILAWSETFAAGLPDKIVADGQFIDPALNGQKIPMAFVNFRFAPGGTKENEIGKASDARNRDGTWSLPQVKRNTHVVCPHCKAAIHDVEPDNLAVGRLISDGKIWMDANGCWICVKPGEPAHVGYQISSLYAPVINEESTWAGRAVQFLTAIEEGGEAVRTFINAVLALVEVGQMQSNRIEVGSKAMSQPDWIPILTADFHKNHPYIWFIVRKWCAFKLGAAAAIVEGKPSFAYELDAPENSDAKKLCAQLVGAGEKEKITDAKFNPAWQVVGELSRFNAQDADSGRSPLVDFLISQKITGPRLVKFFSDECGGNTLEFRQKILLEMFNLAGGDEKKFRASRGGDSELIAGGYCDRSGEYAWDELREIVAEFKIGRGLKIPNRAVFIDSGYMEKFDRSVLRHVHESATQFDYFNPLKQAQRKTPVFDEARLPFSQVHGWDGWQAIRGVPSFQPQGLRDMGFDTKDPFEGTPEAGTVIVDVLNIPTALFWLRKDDLRCKRAKQAYVVSPDVSFFPKHYLPDGTRVEESNYKFSDYEKQSNMMVFDEKKRVIRPRFGLGGSQSKRHPDHVDDAETYQIAAATHLEFFDEKTK